MFDKKNSDYGPLLDTCLSELQSSYELTKVHSYDLNLGEQYGIASFPGIVLFQDGVPEKFERKLTMDSGRIEELRSWVHSKLEKREKIIIMSITSSAFKKSPEDFKNASTVESHYRKLIFKFSKTRVFAPILKLGVVCVF